MRMCAAQSRLRIPADAIKSIGFSEMENPSYFAATALSVILPASARRVEDVTARFAQLEHSGNGSSVGCLLDDEVQNPILRRPQPLAEQLLQLWRRLGGEMI
jgi:hypothetical protein